MIFDHPVVFFAFLVFLPIFALDFIRRKKVQVLSYELGKKLFLSKLFFRLFLAFAIIAMAGPRWGLGYAPSEYRRGLDIVFAIDISRSMDIRDVHVNSPASRLECGLSIAQETITSVTGARYATAIGRGRGYLAVPLTYDSDATLIFLESIDTSSMTGRSTNLESLLDAAIGAFQSTSPARKIVILISDGESHSGTLRNALARCIQEGVIVNTIAIGSDEGRQIQMHTGDSMIAADWAAANWGEGSSRGELSPAAQTVISRREAAVMRNAAERTGGIYIDGNREDASSVLSAHLLSLSHNVEFLRTDDNSKKEPKQRRTLFIMLALAFFAASKFITRTAALPFFGRYSVVLLFVPLLSIMTLFSSCTGGKLLLLEANYLISQNRYNEAIALYLKALNHEESSAYAEYGLGLTFYSLDESESALNRYSNSQKLLGTPTNNEHRELRFRNHYNSGIILFEEGDFDSAAASFKEALKIDPKRTEAKRNLELSLISISMEKNRQDRSEERQEQREILFEYLREEEQEKWRSREWAPEENYSGPDY